MDEGTRTDINVKAIVFEGVARWRCERENIKITSNNLSKVSSIIVEKHCKINARKNDTTITDNMKRSVGKHDSTTNRNSVPKT